MSAESQKPKPRNFEILSLQRAGSFGSNLLHLRPPGRALSDKTSKHEPEVFSDQPNNNLGLLGQFDAYLYEQQSLHSFPVNNDIAHARGSFSHAAASILTRPKDANNREFMAEPLRQLARLAQSHPNLFKEDPNNWLQPEPTFLDKLRMQLRNAPGAIIPSTATVAAIELLSNQGEIGQIGLWALGLTTAMSALIGSARENSRTRKTHTYLKYSPPQPFIGLLHNLHNFSEHCAHPPSVPSFDVISVLTGMAKVDTRWNTGRYQAPTNIFQLSKDVFLAEAFESTSDPNQVPQHFDAVAELGSVFDEPRNFQILKAIREHGKISPQRLTTFLPLLFPSIQTTILANIFQTDPAKAEALVEKGNAGQMLGTLGPTPQITDAWRKAASIPIVGRQTDWPIKALGENALYTSLNPYMAICNLIGIYTNADHLQVINNIEKLFEGEKADISAALPILADLQTAKEFLSTAQSSLRDSQHTDAAASATRRIGRTQEKIISDVIDHILTDRHGNDFRDLVINPDRLRGFMWYLSELYAADDADISGATSKKLGLFVNTKTNPTQKTHKKQLNLNRRDENGMNVSSEIIAIVNNARPFGETPKNAGEIEAINSIVVLAYDEILSTLHPNSVLPDPDRLSWIKQFLSNVNLSKLPRDVIVEIVDKFNQSIKSLISRSNNHEKKNALGEAASILYDTVVKEVHHDTLENGSYSDEQFGVLYNFKDLKEKLNNQRQSSKSQ